MKNVILGLIVVIYVLQPQKALSMEVDSFTPPPHALEDTGPLIAWKLHSYLENTLQKLNANIAEHWDPADLFYNRAARGLPQNFLEMWVTYSPIFDLYHARFAAPWGHSAYAGVHSPVPLGMTWLAPLINLYGIYLGTDKVGHFVQQGHDYYEIYTSEKTLGTDEMQARYIASRLGVHQENTYYGVKLSGVYSNGDLSADYAGLMFYISLAHSVQVGDREIPPALIRNAAGLWQFNPQRPPDMFISPFITPHLSEGVNASKFEYNRDILRKSVKERCATYKRAIPFVDDIRYATVDVTKWFGQDYGHSYDKEKSISFLTECNLPISIVSK